LVTAQTIDLEVHIPGLLACEPGSLGILLV
jgi:hypothetical protein